MTPTQDYTMSLPNFINRTLAVFALCASTNSPATADVPHPTDAIATRHAVQTSAGHSIPVGAFGFLIVPRPREVTLLQLRGIAGSGRAVLRTDAPGICLTFPVRFVAGDLSGDQISGHLSEPIHLVIKSRRAARALAHGSDVVSDSFDVSTRMTPHTDILMQSGLEESFGFVINPGRNILGDIFGVRTHRVSCQSV